MAKKLVDHTGRALQSEKPRLTWKDLSAQSKATITLVLAAVAALALFISNISQIIAYFSTPTPNVTIEVIDGHENLYCPGISAHVRNDGDRSCTITHADIEILEIVSAKEPFRGAGQKINLDVNYDAELDFDQPVPYNIPVPDVAHSLEPGEADAFRITFKPNFSSKAGASAVAFSMRLALTYDGERRVISDPIVVALLMPTFDIPPVPSLALEANALADHIEALEGDKTFFSKMLIRTLRKLDAHETPRNEDPSHNGEA